MSKKDKKLPDWDDGRTIAPMNGDELPKYRRMYYLNRKANASPEEKKAERTKYTKKERRAIVLGGFLAMLPKLIVILLAFGIVALLMYLWLS